MNPTRIKQPTASPNNIRRWIGNNTRLMSPAITKNFNVRKVDDATKPAMKGLSLPSKWRAAHSGKRPRIMPCCPNFSV